MKRIAIKRHYEMDMTEGPLFKKLLLFSVPLMLSGVLQLLYNAADIVVVGRFAGSTALAAVGSTASLINLLINLFIGLSIGASVVIARYYGAGQHKDVSQAVHTAILVAGVAGVVVGIFGFLMSRTLLTMTGTPDDVMDQAVLYLQIYFLGLPASMTYNFGAAILRAVGDTRRPLYYLTIAGFVNVVLNLISVIAFGMGVAGVAIATVVSQVVSAVLVIICLCRSHGSIHLRIKDLRIHRDKLLAILHVGLPAGIQSTVFSISNVLIQSSVNSFGSAVMAGNAAASNLDSFVNITMNAVSQAALSFTGQNMGAKNYRRIGRVVAQCSMLVLGIGLVLGAGMISVGRTLLGIYTIDPQVVAYGMIRLEILCGTYFLCGLMDTFASVLRGMGHSMAPMLVTLFGVCGIRITWLYTVFAAQHTLPELYMSYPVSWLVTLAVHILCFAVVYKKLRSAEQRPELAQNT
ncbi:MAG: MATE family efflux transporter [Clostridia bacterium]